MAIIYIDPSAASNGAGTEADPKNTWAGLTWTAGNAYLQKAGTTFTTAVGSGGRIAPSTSGTSASRILIGAYGYGDAKPKIVNRADTGFNLDRRSYITLENFQIDNTDATTAAIGGGGDTAAEAVGNIVRFNEIYNGTVEGMSFVTQLDRQGVRGMKVHDNYIHDVGGHGIICAGIHTWSLVQRNRIVRAGLSSGKHGISSHPHRATLTPSWTSMGANVYRTAIGSQSFATTVTDIYGVRYTATGVTLARAASDTAPANGEYGFTGGFLYININAVPSDAITFSYSVITVDFCDNIVEDINDFDGQEGHGIQLDDLVNDSYIRRNYISGCEGRGIQVNMGRRNIIRDNFVYNCLKDGLRIDVNGAVLNLAYNNTVVAGPGTGAATAGIVLGANNIGKNNLSLNYATGVTGTAASTEDYNAIFGHTTVRSGGISAGANDITDDPLLTDDYKPTSASPLLAAGTHLGYTRDIERKQRPNPPSIGAYDYATLRTPY